MVLMSVADIKYSLTVGRWAPDSADRMRDAAFSLFASNGFSNVTAEQIAEAAGVGERTFFRHFRTKEDVLFSDADAIVHELIEAVRAVSPSASVAETIKAAVSALASSFDADRDHHRLRASIIGGYPALHERELLKQHQIASAIAEELVTRKIPRNRAMTMAGVGLVVFQVAYRSWTTDRARTTLVARVERGLDQIASDLSSVPTSDRISR
jgi:AcrR family transcriptional regulator